MLIIMVISNFAPTYNASNCAYTWKNNLYLPLIFSLSSFPGIHLVLVKIIEVSVTVVANNLRIVGHLYTKLVPDEAFDLGFNSRSNLLNFSRLFTILCETNCTCFMQTVRHFVYCFENFRGFLSKISRISYGFKSFW